MTLPGAVRLEQAIREAADRGEPAVAAFLTAGFPTLDGFPDVARRVAEEADVLELGVPFSDPMADGITIQDASRQALANGVTLSWILQMVGEFQPTVPIVLMSYLNPLLAYGLDRLSEQAAASGVSGFIVPDLPFDEADPLRTALSANGIALIQLVTPLTPAERRRRIAESTQGFLYAVTRTGTTGGSADETLKGVHTYLRELRALSSAPVLAGFGIRTAEQVATFGGSADGVIIGSALVERLAAGEDPGRWLKQLRNNGGQANDCCN